jgi:hypothetical protein
VPSSLLLGATTYITTDLAAVPLLWVLPLAIYLLTFILAFGRWPRMLHRVTVAITLPLVLVVIFLMVSALPERIWVTVLWHFGVLFVLALACHGALALDRPAPRHLTEFYLLISVGGVLGGLFNALLAPLISPRSSNIPWSWCWPACCFARGAATPGSDSVPAPCGPRPSCCSSRRSLSSFTRSRPRCGWTSRSWPACSSGAARRSASGSIRSSGPSTRR